MNAVRSESSGNEHGQPEHGSLVDSVQKNFGRIAPEAQYILKWIDRFIPEALATGDRNDLRRGRLTVVTGFFFGLGILFSLSVTTEIASVPIRVASYALAIFFLVTPYLLKIGTRPLLLQNGLIGVVCVYAATLLAATGGADSGGLIAAVLVPLIAILICGSTAGIVWSLGTCASLILVGIAINAGFEAPVHPDPAAVAQWNIWAGSAGILCSLGVALTYEWLRETTARSLAEARANADLAHSLQLESQSQFRAQLEQLVEERTEELLASREQLRRADRLASIGTLAAGVAHQINNPVGSILLSAQYALGSEDAADREQIYREALELNAEDAKRCGHIVQNLLRFSRNDSTDKKQLDLNDVTRESVASLRDSIERISLVLCDEPLPIHASGIEVEQVLVNLIRNGFESGQPETAAIEIRSECSGEFAVIHVSDKGHGIKDSDIERIFDPFFTTRITEGGTGLGLSLVHGIVKEHGGTIEVESELGEGTRFSVSLPIAAE